MGLQPIVSWVRKNWMTVLVPLRRPLAGLRTTLLPQGKKSRQRHHLNDRGPLGQATRQHGLRAVHGVSVASLANLIPLRR